MMRNREFSFSGGVRVRCHWLLYHYYNLVSCSVFLFPGVKAHDPIYRVVESKESKNHCGGGCFSTCIPS
jgi:hypothetical protein